MQRILGLSAVVLYNTSLNLETYKGAESLLLYWVHGCPSSLEVGRRILYRRDRAAEPIGTQRLPVPLHVRVQVYHDD